MFPHRPSTEPHDQANMPPHRHRSDLRPRPGQPVRYEPYDVGMRHRDMGDGPREEVRHPSQTPPEHRPRLPSLDAWRIARDHYEKAQADNRNGMCLPDNASSGRSTRETSVAPETVVGARKPQGAATANQIGLSFRSGSISVRGAVFKTPLTTEAPGGRPTPAPNRHVTLPPIGPILQSVPPAPLPPGSSYHAVPPSGQNQDQPVQNGHQQPQGCAEDDMSEYYRPQAAATIPGPFMSPWTRQRFPIPRTNGEAYGMWQLFKVHEADMQGRINMDECLTLHTRELWDHFLKAPQMPYEEKFRQLRYATWYAMRHLSLDIGASKATRMLMDLESSLVEKGHFVERSFLDNYRRRERDSDGGGG